MCIVDERRRKKNYHGPHTVECNKTKQCKRVEQYTCCYYVLLLLLLLLPTQLAVHSNDPQQRPRIIIITIIVIIITTTSTVTSTTIAWTLCCFERTSICTLPMMHCSRSPSNRPLGVSMPNAIKILVPSTTSVLRNSRITLIGTSRISCVKIKN